MTTTSTATRSGVRSTADTPDTPRPRSRPQSLTPCGWGRLLSPDKRPTIHRPADQRPQERRRRDEGRDGTNHAHRASRRLLTVRRGARARALLPSPRRSRAATWAAAIDGRHRSASTWTRAGIGPPFPPSPTTVSTAGRGPGCPTTTTMTHDRHHTDPPHPRRGPRARYRIPVPVRFHFFWTVWRRNRAVSRADVPIWVGVFRVFAAFCPFEYSNTLVFCCV